jgi:hypothetical protein
MGRRLNGLAAQFRILQRGVSAAGASPSLQDKALELHHFHVEPLQHAVHFGSHAADLCLQRGLVCRQHHNWSKGLHQAAASERHNVRPPANLLDVPLPPSATVVHCSALEAKLEAQIQRPSLTRWNVDAAPFVPFAGQGQQLDFAPPVLATSVATQRDRFTPPESHVSINYNCFSFALVEQDITCRGVECQAALLQYSEKPCDDTIMGDSFHGASTANLTQLLVDLPSPSLAAELDSNEGLGVLSINPMPITDNVIIDRGLGNDLPSVQAPLQFDIASDIDSDVELDSPEASARSGTLHIVK